MGCAPRKLTPQEDYLSKTSTYPAHVVFTWEYGKFKLVVGKVPRDNHRHIHNLGASLFAELNQCWLDGRLNRTLEILQKEHDMFSDLAPPSDHIAKLCQHYLSQRTIICSAMLEAILNYYYAEFASTMSTWYSFPTRIDTTLQRRVQDDLYLLYRAGVGLMEANKSAFIVGYIKTISTDILLDIGSLRADAARKRKVEQKAERRRRRGRVNYKRGKPSFQRGNTNNCNAGECMRNVSKLYYGQTPAFMYTRNAPLGSRNANFGIHQPMSMTRRKKQ